jgi:hypothetical protein
MISKTQERAGMSAWGGATGLVAGAAFGAMSGRGAPAVVIGAAMGTGMGTLAGYGIGRMGTLHDPKGNAYTDSDTRGSMIGLVPAIVTGGVALGGAGMAYFMLGEHPSGNAVLTAGIIVSGVAMLAAGTSGMAHVVPEDHPPAPKPEPAHGNLPQPLPSN